MRWQAPEMALTLADRALAGAGQRDERVRLWAEVIAVSASCRLGRHLAVVDRGIAALRLADQQGDARAAAMLRAELAGCARASGLPLVGAAILRPLLSADTPPAPAAAAPALRAAALVQLVGCLSQVDRRREVDDALAEADQLYAEDGDLDADTAVVLRGLLRAVASGVHRRRGDGRAALLAAQEGAELVTDLTKPYADSGQAAARVAVQLVHALINLGRIGEARAVAGGFLAGPVRAPAAAAVGWLGMAVALRVHLRGGAVPPALAQLRETNALAERHRLDTLYAESKFALADILERVGELAGALNCVRTAYGARMRRWRAAQTARSALVAAFGEATDPDPFLALLTRPRPATGRRRAPDEGGLLNRQGVRYALENPVTANDLSLILVDVAKPDPRPGQDPVAEQVLATLIEQIRAAAPTEATVARVGGAEFAVLLPGIPKNQAESWADRLRVALTTGDWAALTAGLTVTVRTTVMEHPAADLLRQVPVPATTAPRPAPTALTAQTAAPAAYPATPQPSTPEPRRRYSQSEPTAYGTPNPERPGRRRREPEPAEPTAYREPPRTADPAAEPARPTGYREPSRPADPESAPVQPTGYREPFRTPDDQPVQRTAYREPSRAADSDAESARPTGYREPSRGADAEGGLVQPTDYREPSRAADSDAESVRLTANREPFRAVDAESRPVEPTGYREPFRVPEVEAEPAQRTGFREPFGAVDGEAGRTQPSAYREPSRAMDPAAESARPTAYREPSRAADAEAARALPTGYREPSPGLDAGGGSVQPTGFRVPDAEAEPARPTGYREPSRAAESEAESVRPSGFREASRAVDPEAEPAQRTGYRESSRVAESGAEPVEPTAYRESFRAAGPEVEPVRPGGYREQSRVPNPEAEPAQLAWYREPVPYGEAGRQVGSSAPARASGIAEPVTDRGSGFSVPTTFEPARSTGHGFAEPSPAQPSGYSDSPPVGRGEAVSGSRYAESETVRPGNRSESVPGEAAKPAGFSSAAASGAVVQPTPATFEAPGGVSAGAEPDRVEPVAEPVRDSGQALSGFAPEQGAGWSGPRSVWSGLPDPSALELPSLRRAPQNLPQNEPQYEPQSQPQNEPDQPVEAGKPAGGRRARAEDADASRHSAELAESTRSLLSELSIRAGSGGRRRAPDPEQEEEQPEVPVAERSLDEPGERALPWQSAGPTDLGWLSTVEPATEPIGPAIPEQPAPETAPAALAENPGEHPTPRPEMRLADLLTEALMAYQNVRDTEPDGNSSALRAAESSGVQPGPSSVPEIGAISYGLGARAAGEPRHRSEERSTEPRWGAARWNLPPSNA